MTDRRRASHQGSTECCLCRRTCADLRRSKLSETEHKRARYEPRGIDSRRNDIQISLKVIAVMSPFDKLHMTSYQVSLVAISCIVYRETIVKLGSVSYRRVFGARMQVTQTALHKELWCEKNLCPTEPSTSECRRSFSQCRTSHCIYNRHLNSTSNNIQTIRAFDMSVQMRHALFLDKKSCCRTGLSRQGGACLS